jgi:hypothetical protein
LEGGRTGSCNARRGKIPKLGFFVRGCPLIHNASGILIHLMMEASFRLSVGIRLTSNLMCILGFL